MNRKLTTGVPELHPIPVKAPWYMVGIDFIGPLSPVAKDGSRYILTISDYFTKWVEVVPTVNKMASTVASSLFKVFMRIGLPRVLLSDNGSEFCNALNDQLSEMLGIKRRLTTPYHPQDSVLKSFEISLEALEEISSLLRKDFDKGLESEGDDVVVKMLNTYVHSLPDGTEKGKFLALDLGGSNFRVLLIGKSRLLQLPYSVNLSAHTEIKDREILQLDKKLIIDDKTKQSTQEELFDFVAQVLCEFEKEHNITENLPIGFTFSFPVHQTSLISGTLIQWTMAFTAAGAEGPDVTKMLQAALKRKGVSFSARVDNISRDVVALVNDTTGTQMAVGIHDPECYVGVILGTGTNACYLEDLKAVKKHKGDSNGHTHVIINTEWGAFGDDGSLEKWRTSFDRDLDLRTENRMKQIFEKMISGRYLGEMVRMVLVQLQDDGLFLVGNASDKLRTPEVFESSYLSVIETGYHTFSEKMRSECMMFGSQDTRMTSDGIRPSRFGEKTLKRDGTDLSACKAIFQKLGIDWATDGDCRIVRRVCEAISTRAARLATMGIVTILRKIGKLDKCTVAIDGTLYEKHPHFRERVAEGQSGLPGRPTRLDFQLGLAGQTLI
eukprot:Em0013g391a